MPCVWAPVSGSTKFTLWLTVRWWGDRSPRRWGWGNHKLSIGRSSRVSLAIFERKLWATACLYPFALSEQGPVSYLCRNEARRVQLSALWHPARGHFMDDTSRLFSLHHSMHQSWSNIIFASLIKFILFIFPMSNAGRDIIKVGELGEGFVTFYCRSRWGQTTPKWVIKA